ncbi:hypothetical protein V1523DRAFT_434659 [Lipomyces doorenjongii]
MLCRISVLDEDENSSHRQQLRIPADIEQVRGHDMAVERRDKNRFGDKFGAHHLMENVIDFEELKPWFLKPTMKGFQELKRITVAYLQDCWTHSAPDSSRSWRKSCSSMRTENHETILARGTAKTGSLELWGNLGTGALAGLYTPEQRQHATHLLHLREDLTTDIPEEQ